MKDTIFIPSKERIQETMISGVCFICATCTNWYKGKDKGLKDSLGDPVCGFDKCAGPVFGGDFKDYDGPLKEYKAKFCYLCGRQATHLVSAKKSNAMKIGLCSDHAKEVERFTARNGPGHTVIIAEHRADPDKYEVSK